MLMIIIIHVVVVVVTCSRSVTPWLTLEKRVRMVTMGVSIDPSRPCSASLAAMASNYKSSSLSSSLPPPPQTHGHKKIGGKTLI